MATLTNVDAEQLRSASQKLATIDTDIIANVRKLSEAIAALDKGWSSTVKAAFMQNWQTDSEALCEMMEQYSEVQELLLSAAQEFERTESDMVGRIGKLK